MAVVVMCVARMRPVGCWACLCCGDRFMLASMRMRVALLVAAGCCEYVCCGVCVMVVVMLCVVLPDLCWLLCFVALLF